MIRNIFILTSAILLMFACSKEANEIPKPPKPPVVTEDMYEWEESRTSLLNYTDLMLIYGGGRQRSKYLWQKDRMRDLVVYKDREGHSHWLFDSFLFLEIFDEIQGGISKSFATNYKPESANKEDWQRIIDYLFQENNAIDAVEDAVVDAKAVLGDPQTKRKVIVFIPEPIERKIYADASSSSKYWGSIDGKELDFSKPADRVDACKWFINSVRARFDAKKYQNVELAGFYWLAEEDGHTKSIMANVGAYLKVLKHTFNWIPFFGADGTDLWSSYGFTRAYLQPNYYFNAETPKSRLDEACKRAQNLSMDIEVEFENDVLDGYGKAHKLRDYMEKLKDYKFWDNNRIAYYQGEEALLVLKSSSNQNDKNLFHDFCQFVISRPYRSKQTEKLPQNNL